MGQIQFGLGGGAGGGLGIFIPESAQSLVPFADNAARDAWATANPSDLLNDRTVIFVTGTPDVWYIWRGESNPTTPDANDWETYTDVVRGAPGTPGADGAGEGRMFESLSAVDQYFGAPGNNFADLTANYMIQVRSGDQTLSRIWLGTTIPPTDYNSIFWRTTGAIVANETLSFESGSEIFNYGNYPAFEDTTTDTTFLPVGQVFTRAGGIQGARQATSPAEADITITAEDADSALQAVHQYTLDTTGLITEPTIITSGTVNFLVAPTFYQVEIFQTNTDPDNREYVGYETPNGVSGVYLGQPKSTQRLLPDTQYIVRFTGDIPFQYRTAAGTTGPAGTLRGFPVTFQNLATEDFVTNNAGEQNVQSHWAETNTAADSYIANKPTIPAQLTTEQIQDIVGAMVAGNTETGITVTYDDANGKLNFVVGTPPTGTENFYTGLSPANNPADVLLSTLTSQVVGTGSGQQFTFSVGPASANDYVIILFPSDHPISSLINTGSGFEVLNSFTLTADVRTEGSVVYSARVLGPLVDTFSASYRATLT